MPIYRDILKISNLEPICDIFESVNPMELPGKISEISLFMDADKEPKHFELLNRLYVFSKEMLSTEGKQLVCVKIDEGVFINMEPFFEFLDELGSIEDLVDDLDEIKRFLRIYLSQSNIETYKSCQETLDLIHFLMRHVMMAKT